MPSPTEVNARSLPNALSPRALAHAEAALAELGCPCEQHCVIARPGCTPCGPLDAFGQCAACTAPRVQWIPTCPDCHTELEGDWKHECFETVTVEAEYEAIGREATRQRERAAEVAL